MTEKLRSNLTLAQFLLGLIVALVPVLVSLGAFLASFQAQAGQIAEIQRDRRETLSDYRDWRGEVDADRATVRAQYGEILRRLDSIERSVMK